jgi:lysyl-tRNA synthetase class 2
MEVGNVYFKLIYQVIRYEQFYEKMQERVSANEEMDFDNHLMDLYFIKAIVMGTPPYDGVGYGIDCIIMLLVNAPTIRDIIPFPIMKSISLTKDRFIKNKYNEF